MSSDPEILVGMLDHLVDEDFGRFQWYLWQDGALKGFRPIPKSKLKKLDRKDTVDEMYQTYSDRTLEVTKTVLEKMNMKGVWEKHFKKTISEPEGVRSAIDQSGDRQERVPQSNRTLSGEDENQTKDEGVDHGGEQMLKPDLRKYFSQLQLDENSMHTNLKLSNNNRKVTHVWEEQPYPDHLHRFDYWKQLLCRNDLSGRCYWEVEWSGDVSISVSYRGIRKKGDNDECRFGGNHQSWSLRCYDGRYYVCHNNRVTPIPSSSSSSSSSSSGRVAVYVDCPAGSLSFFRVSSDSLIHLYTFNTTFTQPLTAGFLLWFSGSSVSLCPV
ncbi:stonustoxin subunit beta-like isoform X1 [Salarias fasciatus]|uniref:stonustoxin subunit beta-like isoform X1 n=1 Tax=Salarias fasciatus TaxID=181472 RepID=UPI00117664F6|nr:stonustoxin subunit beta-like isoform X1 [Salarias fasciatus]